MITKTTIAGLSRSRISNKLSFSNRDSLLSGCDSSSPINVQRPSAKSTEKAVRLKTFRDFSSITVLRLVA